MENSEDPDQIASSEASWSGSTVFLKGYIWIQKGTYSYTCIVYETIAICVCIFDHFIRLFFVQNFPICRHNTS